MRTLIVEDEFVGRMQLKYFLEKHGSCDIAVDGKEAIAATKMALDNGKHYNLICLDIKMPGMDGHEVLALIREQEETRKIDNASRSKIFMTSALSDPRNVFKAFNGLCDEYLAKPVDEDKLTGLLKTHNLV
ncbi:MAG: response regulator [Fibrobacteres bacterium]|nr:response regulator [Fibrobacterota bacterium]